jgi:hypothetical protein
MYAWAAKAEYQMMVRPRETLIQKTVSGRPR